MTAGQSVMYPQKFEEIAGQARNDGRTKRHADESQHPKKFEGIAGHVCCAKCKQARNDDRKVNI